MIIFISLLCTYPVIGQDRRKPGPWDQDLYIFESSDGLRFRKLDLFVKGGGVASIINDSKGRLIAAFQWFPSESKEAFDHVAVKISTDNGMTWSNPKSIKINELPFRLIRPCDPTLVLLEKGLIRLYFTSDPRDGHGPGTYSAISSDGVNYRFEHGERFRIPGRMILDCAVTRLGEKWHYYAPVQNNPGVSYHAISDDGLRFKRLNDVTIPGNKQWLGCVLPIKNGIRFYGGSWSAISKDGSNWKLEHGRRLEGADPGVVHTSEGKYIAIATGPPRKRH